MVDGNATSDLTDCLSLQVLDEVRSVPVSDKDLQRAHGVGHIVVEGCGAGTRVIEIFQQSPIRIMFPRVNGTAPDEAVLVNTAGGIAGGDRLELGVRALPGAALAVTSQAAEKVYRALDEPARISVRLTASQSAKLAWLPQETIAFDGARLRRNTEIEVSPGAELLALEWLALGRTAHGEKLSAGDIREAWRVTLAGRLIWADTLRLTDEIFPQLQRKALLSDNTAVGTLVYFGRQPGRWVEILREITPSHECHFAVTSIHGLLVARFAATLLAGLRLALLTVLQRIGRELGGPFTVPKMWSC